MSRKIEPNVPKYMKNETPLVAANERERNRPIGSIGFFARSSQATKATSSATPPASAATIWGLLQPSPWPRIRPKTTPNRPAAARPTPGRSRLCAGPWDSVSRRAATGMTTSPIGTLIQKIQCHEMPSTTAPPTSGPRATPRPLMADQMPSAAPRFSAGNVPAISVRVSGATIAPPTPCTVRAASSAPADGASAAAAEAAVKSASPPRNSRRRPKRSASAAPGHEDDREGERVGVDRPLQRLERRAEVGADRGKSDGDDEVVEHDHEEGERHDDEGGDGAALLRGG